LNGGAASAVPEILVIDPSGLVFGLLRSLNLEVSLRRVTNGEHLQLDDIELAVIAIYDHPGWQSVVELAEGVTTVLMTTVPNHEDAMRAVASGAFGYIDTGLPRDAVRRAILGVMRGELAHSRRLLADLIRSGHRLRTANVLPLTPRQRQVIRLIAKGAADKEIACSLGITTATAQKQCDESPQER